MKKEKMENIYYNNNKLLTLKDINGKKPEIFLCDGNRTAGKSYSFKSTLLRKWFRKGEQFALIVRNQTDCKGYYESFWKDVGEDKYPEKECTEQSVAKGTFYQILIDGLVAGFVLPLSMASKIKRFSSMFIDVTSMFFDEYQDENSRYLPDEIKKLMSIHTSIARGHGEQTRYVALYMCSNTISLLNPYYVAFGIHKRLRDNTKFLRGDGWVFEKTLNENAKNAFQSSAFNRAFSSATDYFSYASENVYLNDNLSLIEKPVGDFRYIATIKYDGEMYNIRQYSNYIYVSEGCDITFPLKIAYKPVDIAGDGFWLCNKNTPITKRIKQYFECGLLRFDGLKSKNMVFDILTLK